MSQPLSVPPNQGPVGELSRREILAGGSLLLGSMLIAGCGQSKISGKLPGPFWADPGPQTQVTNTIPSLPMPVAPARPVQAPPVDTAPTGIVSRSQWTRSGVARLRDINPMNGIRRITIHHDGMPPATLSNSSRVASRIEQIRQSHVTGRGWADIGYHYVVDPQGRVWEGRGLQYQGAHVKDQNENNLGILVLGNFDVQTPSSSALASLDKFVVTQMQRYNIALSNVRTHQERDQTACPGRMLQSYMVRTRSGAGAMLGLARRVALA